MTLREQVKQFLDTPILSTIDIQNALLLIAQRVDEVEERTKDIEEDLDDERDLGDIGDVS